MTKRIACLLLSATGIAAVGAGWALATNNGRVIDSGPTGAVLTVSGLLSLIAGGALLRRRPDRWTGPFIQLVAISSFAGQARGGLGSASPILGGIWLATILLPGVLALAHPDGIAERGARHTLAVALPTTAVLGPLIVLAAHGRPGANTTWWDTPRVRQARPLADWLFTAHTLVVVVATVTISVALIVRAARSDRASRRVTNPVLFPALVWATATAAGQLARLAGPRWAVTANGSGFSAPATFLFQAAPLLAVSGIIAGLGWVELIEPRLHRATAGLTVGGDAIADSVTGYLRRALADPSATLFFRQTSGGAWLDGHGRPATPAFDRRDRAVTVVERAGVEIGAVEYDAALASQPDTVELAVTAAGLAIDNARLAAVAAARAEEARRVAARLVTSADTARDELEQRLSQGPLAELDAIDQLLAEGDVAAAADRLPRVTAEVRAISHGLYPSELSNGGLASALTQIAVVPARRFPPAIEITAFLAANGDPNASITHEPGRLVITLSRPPADPTLLARVAALGGRIEGSALSVPVAG